LTLTLRNISIGALLALAVSFSCWSIFIATHSDKKVVAATPDRPDAYMENVSAVFMDKTGKPKLKIDTPKMVHYPAEDSAELVSPQVVVYRQSPQPWRITADHAKTKKGITEITFWDNVEIQHQPDTDNPLTIMRTSTLTILPDIQVAKTNEAIVMTQPDTTVHAIGMLANWNDGTVKLLSQAREDYVPKS
jgi:lipopolysaccharide export system protein LptC